VRRGDFITVGCVINDDYYKKAAEKLLAIPDYPNKRFFIFSDDIPWCRKNVSELGFDLFPDADITFIDFNKGENSFRDMQLMSHGKIIISSNSGFPQMAAMLAEQCEVFMHPDARLLKMFEQYVRSSKYNIGSFDKSININ